jgi:hypothetical protein
MHVRSPLVLAAAVPVLVAACAKKPAPAAPATANVVTVIATDYAFSAPDTIPAGLTTLNMVNHGQELHQAVLVRFDSGKTLADLQAMLMQQPNAPPPPWIAFPMGPALTAPGDSANATALLTAGHYAMLCFAPSPDGTPHVAKGMVRALEVAPSTAPVAPEPTADVVITEKDYGWDFSTPITAGTHTIRVENAGPQLHEITVFQLAPGKTAADFQSWLQGGMQGPPPVKPMGGFVGPDPGGHGFFTATFTPGEYVLACFVPDRGDGKPHVMHGMVKPFTVS